MILQYKNKKKKHPKGQRKYLNKQKRSFKKLLLGYSCIIYYHLNIPKCKKYTTKKYLNFIKELRVL